MYLQDVELAEVYIVRLYQHILLLVLMGYLTFFYPFTKAVMKKALLKAKAF
jgi:hypothetical protein